MWPFRKKLEVIVATRDVPALVKRYFKKMNDPQVTEVVELWADDVWDYSYASWRTKSISELDLMFLADELVGRHSFAGNLAVTPIEFWSRMQAALDNKPPIPEATCALCQEYLSQKIEAELVRFRLCTSCRRRYHHQCSAGLAGCKACGESAWSWDIRKRGMI